MIQEQAQAKPLLVRINELEQRINECPVNVKIDPPLLDRIAEIEKTANTSMGTVESMFLLMEKINSRITRIEEQMQKLTELLQNTVIKLKILSEVIK